MKFLIRGEEKATDCGRSQANTKTNTLQAFFMGAYFVRAHIFLMNAHPGRC
jgi:hypothetical protein